MPRKKREAEAVANAGAVTTAVESETKPVTAEAPIDRPAWIDGPPTPVGGDHPAEPAKNWGQPYKAIFTGDTFEMGENRRFKQRVFIFNEKPDETTLAALKENGFVYRAAEKAWTIKADAATRKLCDELARQFAGQTASMSR